MSGSRPLHRLASGDLPRYGGIAPLGLPCPEHSSTTVEGRCYWHVKRRWLEGEQVSTDALSWIGVDGANRQRSGGWRQPSELPVWSPPEDEEQHESAEFGARLLLSPESVRRLEEPEGRGVRS